MGEINERIDQNEEPAGNHVEPYFTQFARRDWQESTSAGPLRIAVVGLGGFARSRALPAIEAASECTAAVLVSSSPEKAAEVAAAYDADDTLTYDEFHAGDAATAYDAVYIATPSATHVEYAETAAELGKHVLCEKPLAATVSGAQRIVDACQSTGVTLMTAYRLRTEPAARRTRDLVRSGCIGRPVQIHSGFSVQLLEQFDADHWRLDPELAGGGAMLDIGVYPLNTTRFLLGSDPTAVQAVTTSSDPAFEDVEENVAFQLTFPDGVTASCTASFNAQPNSQLQVIGTNGQVTIDSPYGGDVPKHILVECGDVRTEHTGVPVDDVREEFAYFANHVLTGRSPGSDGYDGLTDLRVASAVYDSAETGERVALD